MGKVNAAVLRKGSRSDLTCRCAAYTYMYSLLHLECHSIVIFNLDFIGLFSTECGKREIEN